MPTDTIENQTQTKRVRLEKQFGKVWNHRELLDEFNVEYSERFDLRPAVYVERKQDGFAGRIIVVRSPTYYHSFQPVESETKPNPNP